MSAGTKVTLALVVVLIVALVLYYGSLSPKPETDAMTPTAEVEPEPQRAAETAARPERPPLTSPASQPARREPVPDRPTPAAGRLLGDSVDRALTGPDEATSGSSPVLPADPLDSPRDAQPGFTVRSAAEDTGGKDSADLPPQTPADAEDPKAPQNVPEPDPEPEPEPEEVPASPSDEESPAAPPPAAAQPPAYTEYTVKSGDTMSSIAMDWFGTEAKWDLIAKANPLVDPNRLSVGQVLRLPPKTAAEGDDPSEPVGTSGATYIVRSGDSLSTIARSYYSDESKWRIIFHANRDVIGNDPEKLDVGMKLRIPPAPQPAED